jgi:hypothetical protein
MLPTLTVVARHRRVSRRSALAIVGALILGAALVVRAAPSDDGVARTATVAETLAPDTWALTVPAAWLATPLVGTRAGDRLDVLALRSGDRASATAIAFDLLVVSVDERALVVGCRADDATAIAVARASGMLLVPLLRSTR